MTYDPFLAVPIHRAPIVEGGTTAIRWIPVNRLASRRRPSSVAIGEVAAVGTRQPEYSHKAIPQCPQSTSVPGHHELGANGGRGIG
jgi:hypothetical protein